MTSSDRKDHSHVRIEILEIVVVVALGVVFLNSCETIRTLPLEVLFRLRPFCGFARFQMVTAVVGKHFKYLFHGLGSIHRLSPIIVATKRALTSEHP
jgi:hypothetical protein